MSANTLADGASGGCLDSAGDRPNANITPGRYWITWTDGYGQRQTRRVIVGQIADAPLLYRFCDQKWSVHLDCQWLPISIALDPKNPAKPTFERDNSEETIEHEVAKSRDVERMQRYIRKLEAKIVELEQVHGEQIVKPGMQRQARLVSIVGEFESVGEWVDYGAVTLAQCAERYATDLDLGDVTVQVRDVNEPQRVCEFLVKRATTFIANHV